MVSDGSGNAPRSGWKSHLRGHLLLFDPRPPAASSTFSGVRLLLAAALLEIVRFGAVRWLHPYVPLWLLLPALLGLALWVVRGIGRVELSRLGLKPWRHWTLTEKSYFVQVICIANIAFPALLAGVLGKRIAESGLAPGIWAVFVPYLFFGFYQELVYRGMVQLALVSRWGALVGIGAANVLYTLGPLHSYYFASAPSVAIPMFAAIFAIGLFFGLLYQRSGNLWIVAVFHAIGNAYMVWAMA